MKTKLFISAMVALCAMVFTGCKQDNVTEPDDPQPQPDTKAVAAVMQIDLTVDAKTLELFTVSFDYLDADGKKQTETVTATTWSKDIQTKSLPAKVGFCMNLAKKEGVDLSKYEQFTISYRCPFSCYAVNAAGEAVSRPQKGEPNLTSTLSISKIDATLEAFANNPAGRSALYSFDADGKVTSLDWE